MSLFGPGFDQTHGRTVDQRWQEHRSKKSTQREIERWNNMLLVLDTLIEYSQKHCKFDEWHLQTNRQIVWEKYLEVKDEATDD